jgi:hypothetical protein
MLFIALTSLYLCIAFVAQFVGMLIGEWQMALKLFDSLRKAGLKPDQISVSSAILACYKGMK